MREGKSFPQTQTRHDLPDDEEEELLTLLEEINSIQPTILKPSTATTSLNDVDEFSSDLFGSEMGSELSQIVAPLPTISNRPILGESPLVQVQPPPDERPTLDRLPFPISPDQFTVDLFLRNLTALQSLLLVDFHLRVTISRIDSLERTFKIPLVIGIITFIEQPAGKDYNVRISDESGSILATIHQGLSRKPHYGMMAVLHDISIFRPTPKYQCLVIVPRNVKHLISNIHCIQ